MPMGFVNMLIARWHALGRGDVVAISLLAAFLVVAAVAFVQFPILGNLGFGPGFGPDWECAHPGKGEPVCVKKPAPTRG
jgi:hypothetical protein